MDGGLDARRPSSRRYGAAAPRPTGSRRSDLQEWHPAGTQPLGPRFQEGVVSPGCRVGPKCAIRSARASSTRFASSSSPKTMTKSSVYRTRPRTVFGSPGLAESVGSSSRAAAARVAASSSRSMAAITSGARCEVRGARGALHAAGVRRRRPGALMELRLRRISDLQAANAFVPEFIADYNRRSTRAARSEHDAHRPLQPSDDLARVFRWQETRRVSRSRTVLSKRVHSVLDPTGGAREGGRDRGAGGRLAELLGR